MISQYLEFPPPSPLKDHLLCLWTQTVTGSGSPYSHRVLPDGCIDIVMFNGEPPLVVGPYTGCFIASLPPGTAIVGARFHPGRSIGFLGAPASALLNQSVPLDALWSGPAYSKFMRLAHPVSGCGSLRAFETALLNSVAHQALV